MGLLLVAVFATVVGFALILLIGRNQPISPAAPENLTRESATDLISPPLDELRGRIPSVHEVLYLLFNEGYLAAHAESAIRRELCGRTLRCFAHRTIGGRA